MVNFLMLLPLAPVMWGFTWIYASPWRRLDGYFWVKLILRVMSCVVLLGGFLAHIAFLARHEPPNTRGPYMFALIAFDAIPSMAIMFYRYYQAPNSYWSGWNYQAKRPPRSASK